MAYSTQLPPRDFLLSVFQRVDKDNSGFICEQELQQALSNGTWRPFNTKTVRLMISMFDRNNTGTINFDEFGALWKYVTDWQTCFRNFDKDNTGAIDKVEFNNALLAFGYRLNDTVVSLLLSRFDRTHTGVIRFDDFIACCIILHMLTTAFRQHDTDLDGVITIRYEDFLCMILMTLAI